MKDLTHYLISVKDCFRRQFLLELPPSASFCYTNSNNMAPLGLQPQMFNICSPCSEYTSDDLIVVGDSATSKYVLIGALSAYRSQTFLRVVRRAGCFHSVIVEQPHIIHDCDAEELVVLEGNSWEDLLEEYGVLLAKKHKCKIQAEQKISGYCSWYYYYNQVSMSDMLENIAAIQKLPCKKDKYRPQIFQIDDGYQTFQGDWLDSNERWQLPMQEMSQKIIDANLTPGIWLMPFVASSASRIFREHPEFFVKNSHGNIALSLGWSPEPDNLWATLDTTHPGAQEYLKKVFKTFWQWGFRYFKLDGLTFALRDGERYATNSTPVSAFADGMRAMRAAVPEAILMGCCPPYLAAIGYVDICRVGLDTKANWCWLVNAVRSALHRYWLFDRCFRADNDVVFARCDRSELNEEEMRFSLLSSILTGITFTSDNFNTLSEKSQKQLDLTTRFRMINLRPILVDVDEFIMNFSGLIDGQKALALFNDRDVARTIDLAELGFKMPCRELLTNQQITESLFELSPHDAALIVENIRN